MAKAYSIWMLGLVAAAALAGAMGPAAAADNPAARRERELGRRLQLVQQENGELQSKLKALADKEAETEKTAQERTARAVRSAARLARELDAVRKESANVRSGLEAKLKAAEGEREDLRRRLEDTARQLKLAQQEVTRLTGFSANQVEALGRQGKLIEACNDRNAKLKALAEELVGKLKPDTGTAPLRLLGFSEVESYNLFREYRDKLDGLKTTPAAQPQ